MVKHVAGGADLAAVDPDTLVAVDARVAAEAAARADHAAAVDDQPSVGVDAVAFPCGAVHGDGQAAVVDGGDGYIVLVGVDAVIAGGNVDVAAVDGQVQLAVQALVVGHDVEHARAFRAAAYVHAAPGIEGRVILVQLVGVLHPCAILIKLDGAGLIDARHMGAGHVVDRAVGDDDIRARRSGIHNGLSGFLVRIGAFVHIIENHRRSHAAGDVHAVQYQRDHGIGVLLAAVNLYGDLTGAQLSAQHIGAGLGDVYHRMLVGLLLRVGFPSLTLAVGKVLTGQIEHDIIGCVNRCVFIGGRGFAVHHDPFIRQGDVRGVRPFLRLRRRKAHAQTQRQQHGNPFFHHVIPPHIRYGMAVSYHGNVNSVWTKRNRILSVFEKNRPGSPGRHGYQFLSATMLLIHTPFLIITKPIAALMISMNSQMPNTTSTGHAVWMASRRTSGMVTTHR